MNHNGTQYLESKNLILRRFENGDAEPMYRNWANDDQVTQHLTWPTHKDVETSQKVLEMWLKAYADPKFYQWAIVPKDLGEVIGSISVVHIHESSNSVEIGYCIGEAFWGKGYMTESLNAVIKYLFETVGINRIAAKHDVRNPTSGSVMAKCGMAYEGILRQGGASNLGICDLVVRSILREEYPKCQ